MTRRLTLLTGAFFAFSGLAVWLLTTGSPDRVDVTSRATDETRVVAPAFTPSAIAEIPDGVALGPDNRDPELIVLTELTPETKAAPVRATLQPVAPPEVDEAVEERDPSVGADEDVTPPKSAARVRRTGQASVRIDASLDTARGGASIRTVAIGARPSQGIGLSIGTGGDPRPAKSRPASRRARNLLLVEAYD
jgi:hypothetical protein